MITHSNDQCPYCGAKDSMITNFSEGNVSCSACARVIEERIIDESYEGRNFGGENSRSNGKDLNRVGGPINDTDILSTGITIYAKRNNLLGKMRRRSSNSAGSNKQKILKKLEDIGQNLNLKTSVIEKAKDILEAVESKGKLKGRSIEYMIGAILFASCRGSQPIPLAEVAMKLNLDKKVLKKCFGSINKIIYTEEEITVKDTIYRLITSKCNCLELGIKESECAKELSKIICEKEILAGKNPNTIVGCSIYAACKLLNSDIKKKEEIALTCQISLNTILNAYSKLLEYKDEIIPQKYKSYISNLD